MIETELHGFLILLYRALGEKAVPLYTYEEALVRCVVDYRGWKPPIADRRRGGRMSASTRFKPKLKRWLTLSRCFEELPANRRAHPFSEATIKSLQRAMAARNIHASPSTIKKDLLQWKVRAKPVGP